MSALCCVFIVDMMLRLYNALLYYDVLYDVSARFFSFPDSCLIDGVARLTINPVGDTSL